MNPMDVSSTAQELASLRLRLGDHEMDFIGDSPVVVHCHHFNLFWDQTVDDALGEDAGRAVRVRAAHKAGHRFLRSIVQRAGLSEPIERLALARRAFACMGHGTVRLAVGRSGGLVRGEHLHYGVGWREKYGHSVQRSAPADAFATGFSVAATEVAYDLEPGTLAAHEERCIVDGSAVCNMHVGTAGAEPLAPTGVDPQGARASLPRARDGLHEARIAPWVAELRRFLGAVHGDDRGLISAFGVLVTTHLADYYNHAAHDVLTAIAPEPARVEALGRLLREAGRSCAVHTFGGVLVSPEWEGMVGTPSGDPLEVVLACVALARAFGFGRWAVEAFVPGQRLVLFSPGTYESVFSRVAAAEGAHLPGGIFEGAALGIMQLAHADWSNPVADCATYRALASDARWRVRVLGTFESGDELDRIEVVAR